MSKLLPFKKYLTLSESASYLTDEMAETVTEADLLRLALDGHLKLSVDIPNSSQCKLGRLIPIEEAEFKEVPSIDGIDTVRTYGGIVCKTGNRESHVIQLEDQIALVQGLYDLPMLGAERRVVEERYQSLIGGASFLSNCYPDGAFIEGKDGCICQLQLDQVLLKYILLSRSSAIRRLLNKLVMLADTFRYASRPNDCFVPSDNLPRDSVLVVRPDSLAAFLKKTVHSTDVPAQPIAEDQAAASLKKDKKEYPTTPEIANAFPKPRKITQDWKTYLGDVKNGAPWLKHAQIENSGRRGVAARWLPHVFAACLVEKKYLPWHQADKIIRNHFKGWIDEWEQTPRKLDDLP